MALEMMGAVLVASLLGSLHCAAMCGGLVGALGSCGARAGWARQQTSFHAARGVVYAVLGAAAGALGSAVNLAGRYAGVVDGAALVAGVLLVGAGMRGLLAARGVSMPALGTAGGVQRWLGQRLAGSRSGPALRAGLLGVSTALLPCGWLYAFVFAAAGTGSPLGGSGVLVAFWLGTLPALVGVGAIVPRLAGAFGRHFALLSALALVTVGLGTILHRANIPAEALSRIEVPGVHPQNATRLPCHGEAP
ncbi:MAG TPA: sulfite exporter TauE/SafE family protein [Polyangiaceae bacterium]|nr:sulfite exporter TauE/SafE family protein [Polyangiaceae bacterium]